MASESRRPRDHEWCPHTMAFGLQESQIALSMLGSHVKDRER
jgi:hypothetical protein